MSVSKSAQTWQSDGAGVAGTELSLVAVLDLPEPEVATNDNNNWLRGGGVSNPLI
jgi:hypothetical protein